MPAWPRSRTQVLDGSGRPYLDLKANFFAGGTTTPLVAYSNSGLTQAHQQPVVADANGRFPRVYLPAGLYAEQILGTGGVELWYDDGLGVAVPVVDPVTPTPTPDAASYFGTGDVKWRIDGAILPGWVRMNGNSIGNAISGASERANPDTLALFTYLYNNFGDQFAPVIGGRGTNGAAADFAAGKSIIVPSMQGRLAAGLDDMGASQSRVMQTIVAMALTAGSNIVNVSDPSRIALGMFVYAAGISNGTQVVRIAGSTLTLSSNAAPNSTGTVTARLGFLNAQQIGEIGGDSLNYLNASNLPVDMPGGTAVYDSPADTDKTYAALGSIDFGDGGTTTKVDGLWVNVSDAVTDLPPVNLAVLISNPDGGRPGSNLPPVRLGTYYLKL